MRIQELEHITGLDRATIRFYEKEGLIIPKRSENGYRDYTEENAASLKKIRLLRQLGVSVFTIGQLQQGSATFSDILNQQVKHLSDQIENNKRAKIVCQRIYEDGAVYESLDADHYLTLLREVKTNEPEFQETVPRECHPWRRWFARILDYWWLGTILQFMIVVVLRIRPLPNEFGDAIIAVLTGALLVPIEAWTLSRWATTPGKGAMGIRVISANGANLTFREALERSWNVYLHGMCLCIPLLEFVENLRCYLRLTGRSMYRFARKEDIPDPEEMPWDENTEIIYEPQKGKRRILLAALIVVILSVCVFSAMDSIKPRHRSNELTVAEFSENYNDTLSFLNPQADYLSKLQPDGTKNPLKEEDMFYNIETGEIGYTPNEFEYTVENGIIKSVTIYREVDHVFYTSAITSEMMNLTFAIALSQPSCGYTDLKELAEILDSNIGKAEAEICFDQIEISWKINTVNCSYAGDGIYVLDNKELPSEMNVVFTVTMP